MSQGTLRRLLNQAEEKGLNAPSYQISQGDMTIYLYTQTDLKELTKYFESGRKPKRRVAKKKG